MPPAARITDMHRCPAHGHHAVIEGEPTVLIGFEPAARVGDEMKCPATHDVIRAGEPSVIIGHKDAARLGDPTKHHGVLTMGCPSVIIGSSPQAVVLRTDKPFCEECEKARQARLHQEELQRSGA